MENLLAALLYMNGGAMPSRIQFKETLRLCKTGDLVADGDFAELERLGGASQSAHAFSRH
jgi:hypothetical protein